MDVIRSWLAAWLELAPLALVNTTFGPFHAVAASAMAGATRRVIEIIKGRQIEAHKSPGRTDMSVETRWRVGAILSRVARQVSRTSRFTVVASQFLTPRVSSV
ncbi:MAG: hypothetical protein D4S02_16575 [Rhodocyclaceae bacterium]|nr:MAG: hypothetical protein D4S02_16575 [Rhodocyclaceae bacterium]